MTRFEELLKEQFDWPCIYTFKFIIPNEKKHLLAEILPLEKCQVKESKNGKYLSFSITQTMQSPEHVSRLYIEIKEAIPEVIGL